MSCRLHKNMCIPYVAASRSHVICPGGFHRGFALLRFKVCCLMRTSTRTQLFSFGRQHAIIILYSSVQVVRRIKINYVWALGYNILMLPLAAGAFFPITQVQLPPWLAGGAMAFSSVSVVCSSLLLRCYRRPPPVLRDIAIVISD